MDLKSVCHSLGLLLLIFVLAMGFPLVWAVAEFLQEGGADLWLSVKAVALAMVLGGGISALFIGYGRTGHGRILLREALLLVTLSWFIGGLIASLPFFIWARMHLADTGEVTAFCSFVNTYFEAVSGLTATGASILADIEGLPSALLLWRALTHWLGGLGIVVLFVAVLPWISSGSTRIYRVETTGISDAGSADIREMARGLLLIYCGLTLLQMIIMKSADANLSWLAAVTFALSTSSTGGFSIASASAGHLTTFNLWVIIVFMIIGGVNYALYFECVRGRFHRFRQDQEFQTYGVMLLVGTLLVTLNIHGTTYQDMTGATAATDFSTSVLHSAFQVVSIQSSTGFSTADFDQWPVFSQLVLFFMMFVGGCGGSTSGGIKVVRVASAIKLLLLDIEKAYRPAIVRPLCVGRRMLSPQQRQGVLAYFLLMLLLVGCGALFLAFWENHDQIDVITAITACLACISNIGPGLGLVGPTANYGFFSDTSKLFLAWLMVVGRLEVFTVLAVLMPKFWRAH